MKRAARRPEDAPKLYEVSGEEEPPEVRGEVRHEVHADDVEDDVPGQDVAVRGEAAPAVRSDAAVVEWEEPATPAARPIIIVVRAARTVAAHEPTRTITKATVRQAAYIPIGGFVLLRRLWESKTNSRFERTLRAIEATGNLEALAEWTDRAEQARERRHRRRMDWVAAPFALAKTLAAALATIVGCLILLGIVIAVADHKPREVSAPLMGVIHLVRDLVIVIGVAWGPLVLLGPWLGLVALWQIGRNSGAGPAWLAVAAEDEDIAIDETTIARALEALRIPQITAYFKQGLPLQFITIPRRDGRGTFFAVRLPGGVTAERISRRRADFATTLHRLAKEVWPTTGAEAGILATWVADKGALAEGAGPYPLLHDGSVDVFKGVPFGKTLRGDPLVAPLLERNTIAGGMPGQGKSSAARALMLGAALDPTAELRIWVPDSNFDFEAFKPRCSRYVMGAEDERIEEILHDLRDLHAEVQRRGELLVEHEEPQVTRKLANADVGLHPLFCLLEEAHVAIQHRKHGKEIAQLLIDIVRLGRKRAIHMIVSTQAPTKDSMPRDVTRNCSNGIAFAVGDHVANDALLGQGAYTAGHKATELIPGVDRGTAVVKGFTGERSDIVQVYFVSIAKGNDEATPIIRRAMQAIAERGQGVPGRRTGPRRVELRDLLTDLDAVLGEDPTPTADVPALLARHAPTWPPYRSMTGKALRTLLEREHGIKVPSTGNRYPLDPAAVREALARRS